MSRTLSAAAVGTPPADASPFASSPAPYRRLFEEAPVALYRTRPDGSVLDVNRALVRLLGYPDRATLLGVNAADIYANPQDRRLWREQVDAEAGEIVFEMEDRRWDGTLITLRDTARSVRDDSGAIAWYQGMLAPLDGPVVVSGSDGSGSNEVRWTWNARSGRVTWSASLLDVFGYDPERAGPGIEESYGWWRVRVHPDDRRDAALAMHRAVKCGASSWSARYRFRRVDGEYSDVAEYGFVGRDAGTPHLMRGILIELPRRATGTSVRDAPDLETPPVPPADDAQLVKWLSEGNERAFEALWRRHRTSVMAQLTRRAAVEADAEELVADTFLQAWASADTYDPRRGSVAAWLASIARSRAYDRLRKRGRRRSLISEAPEDPVLRHLLGDADEPPPDETILREQVVSEALARLPETQRRAIELAFLKGLSHREVARRLDAPLGTVKGRIRLGLDRLRSGLS